MRSLPPRAARARARAMAIAVSPLPDLLPHRGHSLQLPSATPLLEVREREICESKARQRGRDTLRYHKRLFGQRIAIQCYARIATLSNDQEELDGVRAIERDFAEPGFPLVRCDTRTPPHSPVGSGVQGCHILGSSRRILTRNLLGNAGIEHARPVM